MAISVITPGHRYEITCVENPNNTEIIQFLHKEQNGATELKLVKDGVTNEDLIRVLIDRISFLNKKFPCKENACAITKLQESLFWLEERTRNRTARGVEGKYLP